MLCYVILYYIILYYIILYYIILYYIILYYIILCYIYIIFILYYIILYYFILLYITLHYITLRCGSERSRATDVNIFYSLTLNVIFNIISLPQEIFSTLCELDVKDLSYIFDTSRNQTKIYDYMAQLLAHPLQRPQQKDAFYKIEITLQEEPR